MAGWHRMSSGETARDAGRSWRERHGTMRPASLAWGGCNVAMGPQAYSRASWPASRGCNEKPKCTADALGGAATLRSAQFGQMRFQGPSDRNGLPHDRQYRVAMWGPPRASMAAVRRRARAVTLSLLTIRAHLSEQYFRRPSGTGAAQRGRWHSTLRLLSLSSLLVAPDGGMFQLLRLFFRTLTSLTESWQTHASIIARMR